MKQQPKPMKTRPGLKTYKGRFGMLVRLPPDLIFWLDDNRARYRCASRQAFVQKILTAWMLAHSELDQPLDPHLTQGDEMQLNFKCPDSVVRELDTFIDGIRFHSRAQLITTILATWVDVLRDSKSHAVSTLTSELLHDPIIAELRENILSDLRVAMEKLRAELREKEADVAAVH